MHEKVFSRPCGSSQKDFVFISAHLNAIITNAVSFFLGFGIHYAGSNKWNPPYKKLASSIPIKFSQAVQASELSFKIDVLLAIWH